MPIMTTYKVRIDKSAESDLRDMFGFLISVMSRDGANRYIDMITNEVLSKVTSQQKIVSLPR